MFDVVHNSNAKIIKRSFMQCTHFVRLSQDWPLFKHFLHEEKKCQWWLFLHRYHFVCIYMFGSDWCVLTEGMCEFLPKFSVKGVWKRWIESYPLNSSKDANAVTVFTGVGKINTLKTKMGFARYFLIILILKYWILFFLISTYFELFWLQPGSNNVCLFASRL